MTKTMLLTLQHCKQCDGEFLEEWDSLEQLHEGKRRKCPHCPLIYHDSYEYFDRVDLVRAPHYNVLDGEDWLDKHTILSESKRETLYLAVVRDMNSFEVASRLDVTPSAVRTRLRRIRDKLS